MKAISLHPIDYLRVHLHFEESKTKLWLLFKELRGVSDTIASSILVLGVGLLFTVALMKLGTAGHIEGYYCEMCNSITYKIFQIH